MDCGYMWKFMLSKFIIILIGFIQNVGQKIWKTMILGKYIVQILTSKTVSIGYGKIIFLSDHCPNFNSLLW